MGIGRRQHHALVAASLVTGGVCVCLCLFWFIGAHLSGSGRCIGYELNGHGIE